MKKIASVILAAGESTRMGAPKALLTFEGVPFVKRLAEDYLKAGAEPVIVVLGHEAASLREAIPQSAKIVVNERYELGQFSSLKVGLSSLRRSYQGIFVGPVDQPFAPESILVPLASALARGCAAAVPVFEGKAGHPVILGKPAVERVLEGNLETLAQVLQGLDSKAEVEVHDERVLFNVNTPGQYRCLLERYSKSE